MNDTPLHQTCIYSKVSWIWVTELHTGVVFIFNGQKSEIETNHCLVMTNVSAVLHDITNKSKKQCIPMNVSHSQVERYS